MRTRALIILALFGLATPAQAQVVVGTDLVLTGGPCSASSGSGTPENAVVGSPCDLFLRDDGGVSTILYIKESGVATNTGWKAVYTAGSGTIVTGSGTIGTLPKFTAASALGDSLVSEIAGEVNVNARLDAADTVRATAHTAFAAGAGAELGFNAGNAYLTGYDRGATAYTPLYVRGDPLYLNEGGTVVATINGGDVLIDGGLHVGGVADPGDNNVVIDGRLTVGDAQDGFRRHVFAGVFTSSGATNYLFGNHFVDRLTGASGDTSKLIGTVFGNGITTQTAADTVALIAQAYFSEPSITDNVTGAGGDITEATTVYIDAAPTEGNVNYALHVASGATQLDGTVTAPTSVSTPSLLATANLTIQPTGDLITDPTGNDILPATGYDITVGSLAKKYLALHAAELWVETLVAQETQATIGGRVLVAPTTILTSDLAAGVTAMNVKHNSLRRLDTVRLEAAGKVEGIAIEAWAVAVVDQGDDEFEFGGDISGAFTVGRKFTIDESTGNDGEYTVALASYNGGTDRTTVAVDEEIPDATADGWLVYFGEQGVGPYHYHTVQRNRDGSGSNDWYAGDAVLNTGQIGDGFIDLYSVSGVISGAGPTIVGNVRTDLDYDDILPVWAIGNLNALYGYAADTYGVGLGKSDDENVVIDATNGVRFRSSADVLGQLTGTTWTLGATATEHVSITSTGVQIKDGATVRTDLTAGVLTINDSGGAAVITLDAAAGAEITKKLTLPGANSAIAIGVTPPTSAAAGTGIWIDRTGLYGLDTNVVQAKLDATTGAFTAGGGKVVIDADGIMIDSSSAGYATYNAVSWGTGGTGYLGMYGYTVGGNGNRTLYLTSSASNASTSYVSMVASGTHANLSYLSLAGGDAANEADAALSGDDTLSLNGGTSLRLISSGSISVEGPMVFDADNTFDIGASGATRPRDVFVADDITAGGDLTAILLNLTNNADYQPQLTMTNAGDTGSPYIIMQEADAGPGDTDSGDGLGNILFRGYANKGYRDSASLVVTADAAISGNIVYSKIVLRTTSVAGTVTDRLAIASQTGATTIAGVFTAADSGNTVLTLNSTHHALLKLHTPSDDWGILTHATDGHLDFYNYDTSATYLSIEQDGDLQASALAAASGTDLVLDASNYIKTKSSSLRVKRAIMREDLDWRGLLALQPISYVYRDATVPSRRLGLAAESVADVLGEWAINRDAAGEIQSYDDDALLTYLLTAVQAQQRELRAARNPWARLFQEN